MRGAVAEKMLEAIAAKIAPMMNKKLTLQLEFAEVKSVADDGKSCTVKFLNDSDDMTVEEISTEFGPASYFKPKLNAQCIVAHIHNNDSEGMLIWCDGIESYMINGDQHGGIIIESKLTEQLKKLTQFMESVQNVFQTWIPVPNDGGAALKTASSSFTSLEVPDYSNITNEIVKHG